MAFLCTKKSALLIFFALLLQLQLIAQDRPERIAYNGTLNLKDYTWPSETMVNLDGIWVFHWDELIYPEKTQLSKGEPEYFQLPDLWSNPSQNPKNYSTYGYASFTLKVLGQFKNKKMALQVPSMYCSYTLWVNDQKVAQNGVVANNKEDSKPFWKPMIGIFTSDSDTLNVILQISNHHHSKGGIIESIKLGSEETVQKRMEQLQKANYIHIIGIGLLSMISFIAFLSYKKNYILWFSIFCLMWSLRGSFSNMYLIFDWVPDFSWLIGAKVEYLTLYSSLLVGTHIFHRLYSKYTYPLVNKISLVVNGAFILITVFSPVSIFSGLLIYFFIFLGLILTYVLIAMLNAVIHSEKGSTSLTIGVAVSVGLFFYDLLSYQQIVTANPYVLNIGYLLIYYILGISLIYYTAQNNKGIESDSSMR